MLSSIKCNTQLKNLPKIFDSVTKNLAPNERYFTDVNVDKNLNETEYILLDNSFGQITFEIFFGYKIKKIHSNAFNNTSDKIKYFSCASCSLVHDPPEYDFRSVFSQMVNLITLSIKLNVNYLPTSAIEPIGGKQSKLTNLLIQSEQNLTIKSGAFQHLVQLTYLNLYNFTKLEFEREAFRFKNSSNNSLTVHIDRSNLQGKSNFT